MDVSSGNVDGDIGQVLAVVGVKGWRCCVCNATFPRYYSLDHHMNTTHPLPAHSGRIASSHHSEEQNSVLSASQVPSVDMCFSHQNLLADQPVGTFVPNQTETEKSHSFQGCGVSEKGTANVSIKQEAVEYIDLTDSSPVLDQQQQNTHSPSRNGSGSAHEHQEDTCIPDDVPNGESSKEPSDLPKSTLRLILSTQELLSDHLKKVSKCPAPKEKNAVSDICSSLRYRSQNTVARGEDMEGIEARFDEMHVTRTDSPAGRVSDVGGKQLPSRNQSPSHNIWNVRVHHSLRFKCACGELVRSKHEFKKHRKSCFAKHKNFPCPVCGVVFGLKKGLKQHMHLKGWQTVLCTLCTKQFHDHHALHRHFKSTHAEQEVCLLAETPEKTVAVNCDEEGTSRKAAGVGTVGESSNKAVASVQPFLIEASCPQQMSGQSLSSEQHSSHLGLAEVASSQSLPQTQISIGSEKQNGDSEVNMRFQEASSKASRVSGRLAEGDGVIEISDEDTDNEELMNSSRGWEEGVYAEEASDFAHKWPDKGWKKMWKMMNAYLPCSAGFRPFWAHWGHRGRPGRGMGPWGHPRPPFFSPHFAPPPPHFNPHFPPPHSPPPFAGHHGPFHPGDSYGYDLHHHGPHHLHHWHGRHAHMHGSHPCNPQSHECSVHCGNHSMCQHEPHTSSFFYGEDNAQEKNEVRRTTGEENASGSCAPTVRSDPHQSSEWGEKPAMDGSKNSGDNSSGEGKVTGAGQVAAGEDTEYPGMDFFLRGGRKKQIFAFLLSRLKEGDHRLYCPDCGHAFEDKEALKVHCAREHRNKRFPCFVCDERMDCPDTFAKHVRRHFLEFRNRGGHPFGMFRGRGRGFLDWSRGRGVHAAFRNRGFFDSDGAAGSSDEGTCGREGRACPVCKDRLPADASQKDFELHVSSHLDSDVFSSLKCEECGKSFPCKSTYLTHLAAHEASQAHACDVCGKEYMARASLLRHMRTHTGTLPLKCDVCGERFLESRELIRHQTTHTGQAAYTCSECGAGFTLRSSLLTHTRSRHTGEKPFPCPSCPKRFASSSLLSRHRVRCRGGLQGQESPSPEGGEAGMEDRDSVVSMDAEPS